MANLALEEKKLNSLKQSSCKFGFSNNGNSTSYSSTFKPFEKLDKNQKNFGSNKNNIEFNRFKSNEIEKKTIYKTDYVDRCVE